MAGKKSNPSKKAKCAASWAQGEKRKADRRALQDAAHKRNEANVSPWALAKAARHQRRHA